jgi:RNA-binding protein YlmH
MKNKEEEALFAGRIRDLARQAGQNDYLTHTGFLSLSEQARADAVLRDEGTGYSRPLFYGGNREADRKVLLFLPSYMEAEETIAAEDAGDGVTACLEVRVRGARFTKEIGHRDCLGALMHLGIGREQIGDILLTPDGTCAYIYVLAAMADHIRRELVTIGRAHVDTSVVPPSACTVKPVLVPGSGSIASVRIDSLIATVFHISRSAAQDIVSREEVFADGRTVRSSAWEPPAGCRISVRGHGKLIYDGEEKTTKKGRIVVKYRVFA